ncbi:hypothetical protein [Castellaniella sp.]|uniref:hypothetical protein n=1 Tax=Castellaniella sp. TaxID=1955812 RepID=UPI002AFFD1D5|nr:hypothetical protein [Castellaniella sp.]
MKHYLTKVSWFRNWPGACQGQIGKLATVAIPAYDPRKPPGGVGDDPQYAAPVSG